MDEEKQNENRNPAFESLDILIARWKEGTFGEIYIQMEAAAAPEDDGISDKDVPEEAGQQGA